MDTRIFERTNKYTENQDVSASRRFYRDPLDSDIGSAALSNLLERSTATKVRILPESQPDCRPRRRGPVPWGAIEAQPVKENIHETSQYTSFNNLLDADDNVIGSWALLAYAIGPRTVSRYGFHAGFAVIVIKEIGQRPSP